MGPVQRHRRRSPAGPGAVGPGAAISSPMLDRRRHQDRRRPAPRPGLPPGPHPTGSSSTASIISSQKTAGVDLDSAPGGWSTISTPTTSPTSAPRFPSSTAPSTCRTTSTTTIYSGYTDLIGIEGRYDLTKRWDIGLTAAPLHSWSADRFDYSSGASVGYNVVQNAWISLGYNFAGFKDQDFSAADYTAQGPFVKFRVKFDQDSVRDAAKYLNNL